MVKGEYGATVDETRSGKPVGPYVRTARSFDLDLIFELPYGPAAINWLQQRPDRWLHPDYALNFSEKQLAPGRASTDGPQYCRR